MGLVARCWLCTFISMAKIMGKEGEKTLSSMQALRWRWYSAHAPRELADIVHSWAPRAQCAGAPDKISSNEFPECKLPAP